MRIDFGALRPLPTAVVSNLPYSVATPVILRTIEQLPSLRSWTVMVQREIADRLRAAPGSRTYGSPSVLVQLACEVRLLRKVDPAVFRPRPRVDSAILELRRTGPGADPATRELVRAAFAHRRKALARSVKSTSRPGSLAATSLRSRHSACQWTAAPSSSLPTISPPYRRSCAAATESFSRRCRSTPPPSSTSASTLPPAARTACTSSARCSSRWRWRAPSRFRL